MSGQPRGRTSASSDLTSPVAHAAVPLTRWDAVAVALLAGVVAGMHVGKVPPVLPDLRGELGLGLVAAGWMASAIAAATALLGLAVGALADRTGPARPLAACMILLIVGGTLGAAAPGAGWLLAGRLVEAAGFVGIVVSAPRLIVLATAPGTRAPALGVWGAYMPCGMAIAMLAAGPVLAVAGWRGLWVGGVVLSFLCLVAVVVVLRPSRLTPPAPMVARLDGASARDLLTPAPWLFGGAFLLYSLQWFAVMTWLPTFLGATLHLDRGTAAAMTALVVGVNAIGNLGAAWLLHRGARRWPLIATALTAMALCGGLLFSPFAADAARLPLAIAFSLVGGMLPAAALSGAPALLPRRVGLANGIVVQFSGLGSLLGPPVMALAVGAAGADRWDGAWLVMAGCGVLAVGIVMAIRRVDRV